MNRFFIVTLAGIAMALSAMPANASNFDITGILTSNPFGAVTTFGLSGSYNPNDSGNTATLTDLILSVPGAAPGVFASGTLQLTSPVSGTTNLVISGVFANGGLSLTVSRNQSVPLFASIANIDSMLRPGSTLSGSYFQTSPAGIANLGGVIAVPEPGSISLLAGLGLVCGRRVWRRRQQKQAAAV